MNLRPFRFGITIGDPRTREEFVDHVRRIEDTGFDIVAAVDHIGPPMGALPLLSAAAQVSGLRVSTQVLANDYRHPVLVAKDAATIDVLSAGRFELGIGTGWIKDQYDSAGIRYDPPGMRVDRLEEALAVIKGSWTGKPFAFVGEHYNVNLVGSPVPVQRPGPPILIGGSGPRMLHLAGREADIAGITATHGQGGFTGFAASLAEAAERIDRQLEWVREGAGDRIGDIELSTSTHVLLEDDDAVAAFSAETGVPAELITASPHVFVGPTGRIVETLIERRERFGFSYIVFRDPQFSDAAPVVQRLSGL